MVADKDDKQKKDDAEHRDVNKNEFTAKCIADMRPSIQQMADARRAHKVTQEEFASELGVTVEYIGKIEQSRSKLPAYLLMKYCQEFNLSADDLFKLARTKEEKREIDHIEAVIERLPKRYLDAVENIINLYIDNSFKD